MCVLFVTQFLQLMARTEPVNRFNHTTWVAIVTPTSHLKSVRNRCVIEVFGGLFVVTLLYGLFYGVSAFV